ncbi:hypothetical protein [Ruegeria jejuensis]|uniref:hypothetical protein n=1 Tax=Ruegeria jejuensis TaxID=3233338 RepID=UPI00355C140A
MSTGKALDELKSSISLSRKQPFNFAICLGKAATATVFKTDRKQPPEALVRLAKKEGETQKVAFGTFQTEGAVVALTCLEDPPPGLAKATKKFLHSIGLKLKVVLLDITGAIIEDSDAELPKLAADAQSQSDGASETIELIAVKRALAERMPDILMALKNSPKRDPIITRLKADLAAGNAQSVVRLMQAVLKPSSEDMRPKEVQRTQIFVVDPTGKLHTVQIPLTTNAGKLMGAILKKIGAPADLEFRAKAGGHDIKLNDTLAANGITKEATITMMLQLLGGGKNGGGSEKPSNEEVDQSDEEVTSKKKRKVGSEDYEGDFEWDEEGQGNVPKKKKDGNAKKEFKNGVLPKPEITDAEVENLLSEVGVLDENIKTYLASLATSADNRTQNRPLGREPAAVACHRLSQLEDEELKEMNPLMLAACLRSELDCFWHDIDVPGVGGIDNVVTKAGVRSVYEGDPLLVKGVRLNGRPAPKHGGKNGQHSSAFLMCTEAIQTACCNLEVGKAKENMAVLFKNLLKYPAFSDPTFGALVDPALRSEVERMSSKKNLEPLTLDSAIRFYLEVRETLPGASLASDMNKGASPKNTEGHGEGACRDQLNEFEAALGGELLDENGQPFDFKAALIYCYGEPDLDKGTQEAFDKEVRKDFLELVSGLLDDGSLMRLTNAREQLAKANGISEDDAKAACLNLAQMQIETYLMNLRQTNPRLFAAEMPYLEKLVVDQDEDKARDDEMRDIEPVQLPSVGFEIARHLLQQIGLADDILDETAREMINVTETLTPFPHATKIDDRFGAADVVCEIIEDEDGGHALTFSGRPKVKTQGGSEGDHTVSMKMMGRGLEGALLVSDQNSPQKKRLPTKAELLAAVKRLISHFEQDLVDDLFADVMEQDDETPLPEQYRERAREKLAELTEICGLGDKEQEEKIPRPRRLLIGDDNAVVDPADLSEIAELAMAVCNNNPIGRSFDGVPGGHDEAGCYARLSNLLNQDLMAITIDEWTSMGLSRDDIEVGTKIGTRFFYSEEQVLRMLALAHQEDEWTAQECKDEYDERVEEVINKNLIGLFDTKAVANDLEKKSGFPKNKILYVKRQIMDFFFFFDNDMPTIRDLSLNDIEAIVETMLSLIAEGKSSKPQAYSGVRNDDEDDYEDSQMSDVEEGEVENTLTIDGVKVKDLAEELANELRPKTEQ